MKCGAKVQEVVYTLAVQIMNDCETSARSEILRAKRHSLLCLNNKKLKLITPNGARLRNGNWKV